MCAVLDDLVIALYVTVDEQLEPRRGPGCRPRLSDAELVCLAVAQVLLGYDSERRWLRAVANRLGHLFPYVCGQAAYNRRLRGRRRWWHPARLGGGLAIVVRPVAAAGRYPGPMWAKPGDRQALRARRPRRLRLRRQSSPLLLGAQAVCAGRPGRHAGRLVPGQPQPGRAGGRRGLLDRAARQGVLRPGMVVLADKGLAGRQFDAVVGELGATLARPDRRDEPYRFGSLGGVRQWVEAIFDTRKDQLGLEHHGAHTIQGAWIRVAQRLLALAADVWFNWQLGAPVRRSLVAFDH